MMKHIVLNVKLKGKFNPEKVIMSNGRHTIKGICSFCNCNVFQIRKIKKE